MNIWTEQEDLIIKYNYKGNLKSKLLELLPNRNWQSILSRASKLKIKYRDLYTKDELFFSVPNLVNSWTSGFIAGDGSLGISRYKRLSFGLAIKDLDILEKIKEYTKFTGKIRIKKYKKLIKNVRKNSNIKPFYENESTICYLEINRADKWFDDLNKNWNIIPNKTKILIGPNLTSLAECLAFISGNICADGTIYYNFNKESNQKSLNISFLGTEQFLCWIKNVLDKIIPNIRNSIVTRERKSSNIYFYKISGVKSYLISKMILSLDIYHMERKWSKARDYIKMVENLNISKRFLNLLKNSLTSEIISFVKGTPQEFSANFLKEIGYLPK